MNIEPAAPAPRSFYEAVGGEEFFDRLVHRFYELVAEDPELRAVYPAQDLTPAEDHLRLFLIQYWGGPQTYNELRGHPRVDLEVGAIRVQRVIDRRQARVLVVRVRHAGQR